MNRQMDNDIEKLISILKNQDWDISYTDDYIKAKPPLDNTDNLYLLYNGPQYNKGGLLRPRYELYLNLPRLVRSGLSANAVSNFLIKQLSLDDFE